MAGALRKSKLCRISTAFMSVGIRSASSMEAKPEKLSKNLSFRPAFDSHLDPETRPLTLIYGWLVAKSRHIHKYGDFYLGKGFDVLHIKIQPHQMLKPTRTQEVVHQIVEFAHDRQKQPVLVHGFSVGAYLFGETLNKMVVNPEKYNQVLKRIVGQVFDSPVDYTEIPEGFSKAVTDNKVAQTMLRGTIENYLKLFYHSTTRHYKAASDIVKENPMEAPALMLYSDSDPVSSATFNEQVSQGWRDNGHDVSTKCFTGSPHVSHFQHHPVEYITQLNMFLERIGLAEQGRQASQQAATV